MRAIGDAHEPVTCSPIWTPSSAVSTTSSSWKPTLRSADLGNTPRPARNIHLPGQMINHSGLSRKLALASGHPDLRSGGEKSTPITHGSKGHFGGQQVVVEN